jgi:hypothetical protein
VSIVHSSQPFISSHLISVAIWRFGVPAILLLAASLHAMLALLVQALGSRTEDKLDARNGLRATIVDQDARATQAQLHHVRKGIASGALHAGGAEPHISLCSSSRMPFL